MVKNNLNQKNDYQELLQTLAAPLHAHYSKGKARLKLGVTGVTYTEPGAELEGFARALWGLGPLWTDKSCVGKLTDVYIEGIKNGANPNHPEYWGKVLNYDQRFVEMVPLTLALHLNKELLWDALDDTEKHNLHSWLNQINDWDSYPNNWQFFGILVNAMFKSLGLSYNKEKMEAHLAKIDSYYLGDGWYSDGNERPQRDYYISFAMHFYGIIFAKTLPDDPRSEAFKERAKIFASDFINYFAANGPAIPHGRSLVYRFAHVAFWSALVYADIKPFDWGIVKGIIQRNLQYWMTQPIFSPDGVLSLGYAYPNLIMTENYNAPGSPYWAFKAFILLAVDDDHPFWSAESKPLPVPDAPVVLPHAYSIISHIEKNHAIMLTSGQHARSIFAHEAEKYEKFAYSSHFGFSVPRSYFKLEQAVPDNCLYSWTTACAVCEESARKQKSTRTA